MLRKLRERVVLPTPPTAFEVRYLQRMNKIGIVFFALHVPALVTVALLNHTEPLRALVYSCIVLAGPSLAYLRFDNPRTVSLVYGFTAMLMGALLVHFGQGPVQTETHFYFFALLALLSVFANPMVIVVAAVTVTLHHLLVWLLSPTDFVN